MTYRTFLAAALASSLAFPSTAVAADPGYSVEQALSFPFPSNLVAAPSGARIAWLFFEKGVRNVYAAEGPLWQPRRLTSFTADDGIELTQLTFSGDGNSLIFVRGGDHGAIWDDPHAPNPSSWPLPPKVEVWAVPFAGGAERSLGEGDRPVPVPGGDRLVFQREGKVVALSLSGAAAAEPILVARDRAQDLTWSPDGKLLAFVSVRGGVSYVSLYSGKDEPVRYLAAGIHRDTAPRFSPDGKRIAFVRRPGEGGVPPTVLDRHPQPWEIWVADVATGEARAVWKSPETLWGSLPNTRGEHNLAWGAGDRLVFLANLDGWPHVYSVPAAGGEPLLLTPGKFMAEYVAVTPDGRHVLYNANTGPDPDDDDRRHLFRVPVDAARPEALTRGDGIEWAPTATGDGATLAFLASGPKSPPLPRVMPMSGGPAKVLAADRVPADFPGEQLVTPRKIVFRAPDGLTIHGQVFATPAAEGEKRPALVYVHGGPPRQMLLGFHYGRYYANAYAINQYLASRGFVVLAVNFRRGIGYGYDFKHPPAAGPLGASEYQDVLAAGQTLQKELGVDPARIGVFGGSYGGYLTALALARNSDVFKAGADWHGVHDWTTDSPDVFRLYADRFEKPADLEKAHETFWRSSPVADIATWKSPVLLIHGDDDRNVRASQTVDLIQRLKKQGVRYEELILIDEPHDFLRYVSWVKATKATAEFLARELAARP